MLVGDFRLRIAKISPFLLKKKGARNNKNERKGKVVRVFFLPCHCNNKHLECALLFLKI